MVRRSAKHASFTIRRTYKASPAKVYAAWTQADLKTRWFGCHPEWLRHKYEIDFRVGGHEFSNVGPKGGTQHIFDATFLDIVPDQRIVYAYDLLLDETKISVSLATIQLAPAGKGTRLIFTEQAVFLDGYKDRGSREMGTGLGLDALGAFLKKD